MSDDVMTSGSEREPRQRQARSVPEGSTAAAADTTSLRRDALLALAVTALGAVGVLVAKGLGAETPSGVLALGVVDGLIYAGSAAAVALVYRLTGVVPLLALGLGFLGLTAHLRLAGSSTGLYWPVLLVLVVAGGLIAVGAGRIARGRSSWSGSALTLAVGLAATGLSFVMQNDDTMGAVLSRKGTPPGLPEWHVGALLLAPGMLFSAALGLAAVVAAVLVGRGVPRAATIAWALLGALIVGDQIAFPPITPGSGYDRVFVVLALAGLGLMRPLLVAAVGLVWGVVEQLGLWNTPDDHPLLWLSAAALLVMVVANLRTPTARAETVAGAGSRLVTEVPAILVIAAGALILAVRSSHTDRAFGALVLAGSLLAVSQVLLSSRAGVDLSLVLVMAVGAEAAIATGHDLLVTGLVSGLAGAVVLLLLHAGTGRRAWTLTCSGAALLLVLIDQLRAGLDNDLLVHDTFRPTLFGHSLEGANSHGLVVIGFAVVSLLVARWVAGRGATAMIAAAGAIAGWAGLAYVQGLATTGPESYQPTAVVAVTVAAAAVAARSGTWALAVAVVLTGLPYTLGEWWGHSSGMQAALGVAALIAVVLAPRLKKPTPSIG